MVLLLLSISLHLLIGHNNCFCNKPSENELVNGANEVIDYPNQQTKQLKGVIKYPDESPVENAIIEIYKFKNRVDPYLLANDHYRLNACKTDQYGRFCFNDLPPGKYVVKVGTTDSGYNAVYFVVTIFRIKIFRGDKEVNIVLSLGS